MNWRIWVAFLTVGILWGSAWIITPMVLLPELAAGAVRFAIAAAVLVFAALRLKSRIASAFPLLPSLLLGITLIGLPYALAVWAKNSVSSGLVAVLYAAMPLAALFLGRVVDSAVIPALAIGMGGVVFLVAQGIESSAAQLKGVLFLAIAVILGAFSLNYAKSRILKGTILLSAAMQCAVASAVLGLLSWVTGQWHPVSWDRQSLLALLALALVEGAIALPLLYWLLARMEPWQAGMLQWLATLAVVVEAACFLRAKPSFEMSAGVVMITVAMFWLIRRSVGNTA